MNTGDIKFNGGEILSLLLVYSTKVKFSNLYYFASERQLKSLFIQRREN